MPDFAVAPIDSGGPPPLLSFILWEEPENFP